MYLAVTVLRLHVRSQVGSQHEIHTTQGLEDETACTHAGSFGLPYGIQTNDAHPTPVPGKDNWVDELRVFVTSI